MRKLKSFEVHGMDVQDLLDEFNARAGEFGVTAESDIVSVCELDALPHAKIAALKEGTPTPRVRVLVVYWAKA
jgi:hypothetical protein